MFKKLCEIFETKTINKELVNKIYKASNNSNTHKLFAKKYLIEFLIDINDNLVSINKEEDFWFAKEENKDKAFLINKYIELVIEFIKQDSKDFENLEIIKIISEFLDTSISKKILLFYLIINKCYLPQTIIIQFIGFILGENQTFIKNNYLASLKTLLNLVKIKIDDIDRNVPLYEINEKLLEIINIYFYLYIKNSKVKNFEEEEEEEEGEEEDKEDYLEISKNKNDDNILNVLYKSLLDKARFSKLNLEYFYKKLYDEDLNPLFSYENDSSHSTENILFKKKIDAFKNEIILNIEKCGNNNSNNFYIENNNKIENQNIINDKNEEAKDIEDNQIIGKIKNDNNIQENN